MKNQLLLIFSFLFIYSCNLDKNGILVEIKNNSGEDIYNVSFSTNDTLIHIKFDTIKSSETVEEFLDMNSNEKGDGEYILEFNDDNGGIRKTNGGYYTNGTSLNSRVVCEVKDDTILLNFN